MGAIPPVYADRWQTEKRGENDLPNALECSLDSAHACETPKEKMSLIQ